MKIELTHPLVKLPANAELVLYLIKEELKSQKFFNNLHEVGLDDIFYRPQLGELIMALMELDDGSDDVFNFFYEVVERRSKKIRTDNDSVMKQALKVYLELIAEKKRRE